MVPVIVGILSTVQYRYNLLVNETNAAKVAMTIDCLILVPDRLLLRPPPKILTMTIDGRSALN